MIDLTPFILSLKLSAVTTLILLVFSFFPAWFLAVRKNPLSAIAESFLTLPLVLPPTVIGFYILLLLSPRNPPGALFEEIFNYRLAFSFPGLVIASVIYSLPFMVQPLKNGFENLSKPLLEASWSLGKSKLQTFFHIILPQMKTFIITAAVMTFAHTMGEFGVILMVGGNLAGKTRVASIAIFENVEMMNYRSAHIYSLILIILSLTVLVSLNLMNHQKKDRL
jgi:molybdate transport system permease protein